MIHLFGSQPKPGMSKLGMKQAAGKAKSCLKKDKAGKMGACTCVGKKKGY